MSARDDVFEPLHGKGRPARQALELLVERWSSAPLDPADDEVLEEAVHHLLRRAQLRRQLSAPADPIALARDFTVALRAGKGREALERLPLTSPAPPTARGPHPRGR